MDDFTLEELEEETKRRAMEKASSTGDDSFDATQAMKAFAFGAASAGIDITALPFIPGDIVNEIVGTEGPKAGETYKKAFKQQKETDFPGYERFFRFGEGAAPGAGFGFAAGGPVGAVVGGLGGGIANVSAKELFPESPVGQMVVQMAAPTGGGMLRARKSAIPSTERAVTPSIDPDTGLPITAGQRTGSPELLAEEQRVRGTLQGAPAAQQFDKAQAQSFEDFFDNIQQLQTSKKLTDTEISTGIIEEYDKFNRGLINKFKAQNTANFTNAKKTAGNADIIPTTNVQKEIDSLIAQYDNPEVPGLQAIASSLKKIKQELTTTEKTGGLILSEKGVPLIPETITTKASNINIDRLQQNLSAWGDAAYRGTFASPGRNVSEFADASPGVVKGIARRVLTAFKNDLDEAAQSGVKGAAALKSARDAYAKNINAINEVAARPLNKYFDVASPSSLVPETVVKKFINLPPSQKAEVASVLQSTRPDIWENLRERGFQTLMDKARNKGAAANEPKFNLSRFSEKLGELDDPAVSWLFPTKQEKNQFKAGLKLLQKVNQKGSFSDPTKGEMANALRAMQEGGGALGGAKIKYGLQFLTDAVRSVIGTADDRKLSYLMFSPNGRQLIIEASKSKPDFNKVGKLLDSFYIGTASSALTAKEVPTATERLGMSQEDQSSFFSLEQLESEAQKRGLQ
jgi:hypothetical protein